MQIAFNPFPQTCHVLLPVQQVVAKQIWCLLFKKRWNYKITIMYSSTLYQPANFARKAGNTGLDNVINSILDELLRRWIKRWVNFILSGNTSDYLTCSVTNYKLRSCFIIVRYPLFQISQEVKIIFSYTKLMVVSLAKYQYHI